MKHLFTLIVLAAVGYLGYLGYKHQLPEQLAVLQPYFPANSDAPATDVPAAPATASQGSKTAAPADTFRSHIEIPTSSAPGEKHLAPPGTFYMLDRISTTTDSGIRAVVPGDAVKLLKRVGDGTLKLTDGVVDFVAKEAQVTNDLDLAREAERKERLIPRARL